MRCKIIEKNSRIELECAINEFIKDGHSIQHISYATCKNGYSVYYSALILYTI